MRRAGSGRKMFYFLCHANDLLFRKAGIHRKREDFPRHNFGHDKVAILVVIALVRLLTVKRNGIMKSGEDVLSLEMFLQLVSPLGTDNIQVIDRCDPRGDVGNDHAIHFAERPVVL